MKTLRFFKFLGIGILALGFITLTIFVTMSLWNSLIPVLFHGPVLSFWQTVGLFILSKILLTGVAPGGHDRGRSNWWRKRYQEKYRHRCREEEQKVDPEQA
ncbi:MAG: hypothetical protein WA816_07465 [Bacteroidales bacterium]